MREFNIKDIVMRKDNDKVLYMVVDYADFSQPAPNGKPIIDIDYELVQIYPITRYSKISIEGQDDLIIKEPRGSKNHDLLMKFIQKDREKAGWFGVPDFVQITEKNIEAIRRGKVKEVQKPKKEEDDTIRYNMLDSVDKCLDALNDLKILHEMFGDESYLQLQEVVTARIITLSK